jgi:hypothetical protein
MSSLLFLVVQIVVLLLVIWCVYEGKPPRTLLRWWPFDWRDQEPDQEPDQAPAARAATPRWRRSPTSPWRPKL